MNASRVESNLPAGTEPEWLVLAKQQVSSLRFGVVQIVVHDAQVPHKWERPSGGGWANSAKRPANPITMNLVDLQATAGAKPALAPRHSNDNLLAPLEQIAANSSHLAANHEVRFEADGRASALPRCLFAGAKGGGDADPHRYFCGDLANNPLRRES